MIYIIEFFIFAFLGWIIDSVCVSLKRKGKVISGYFQGVPICPIYGFGGILLLNTFALLSDKPFWVVIPLTTLLIIALEYVGGWLSELFLEERLWDYSDHPFNLHGYICLWVSFQWLLAVSFLYVLIGSRTSVYIEWLQSKIFINTHLEVLIIFVIVVLAFWVTVRTKKMRLSKLAEKRLSNMKSIEEIFDFSRLEALRDEKRKEILSNKNIEHFLKKIEEWKKL